MANKDFDAHGYALAREYRAARCAIEPLREDYLRRCAEQCFVRPALAIAQLSFERAIYAEHDAWHAWQEHELAKENPDA